MRRVRATFFLRCVVLAVCVTVFFAILQLGASIGWTLGALVGMAVLWFVGIEGVLWWEGAIPYLLERIAVRRAARSGKPVSSIWFVDLDEEAVRESSRVAENTRDNPTIR